MLLMEKSWAIMYIVSMALRIDQVTLHHLKILDKYLSLIPAEAKERDAFYLTPLPCKPQDPSMPWYSAVPVGRNRLGAMLKEMCQEAGVLGKYSNHSLRAGGAREAYSRTNWAQIN